MKYIIPLAVVLILFVAGFFIYMDTEEEIVEEEITRERVVEMLKTDEVGREFLEDYSDFEVDEAYILTKEQIEERKEGWRYTLLYEDLLLEDNRYMKLRLVQEEKGMGVAGTFDLQEEEMVLMYYLFLVTI